MDSHHSSIIGVWCWLFFGFLTKILAESMPEIGDMDSIGGSSFTCQGKVIGGYYADVDSGCQMFHVCTLGQEGEIRDIKFLCLAGTIFDQETRVCERVDEVDCSQSEQYYHLNLDLFGRHGLIMQQQQQQQQNHQIQGRKVPAGDVGLLLSDEEYLQLQLDELNQQNGHIQPEGYPYSSNFDPDYDDEDYEDDLAVIIQQEFETGTTTSTIPTTTTTSSTTTSTTTPVTTTTTTTAPTTTASTTTTTTTTTERPPSLPDFDVGSPAVVRLQQQPTAISNWTTVPSPTTVPPQYVPHHYVVRQEFSVSSITNYVRPSTIAPTAAPPPAVRPTGRSRQDEEDEDVYKLLGEIEADVPRIRTSGNSKVHHSQSPSNSGSAVFVPRFKRQAQGNEGRRRNRTRTDAAGGRRRIATTTAAADTAVTTTTPSPVQINDEGEVVKPTGGRRRISATTVATTTTTTSTTTTTQSPINIKEDEEVLNKSNFNCVGRIMGGFYADVEAGCRQFHICGLGKKQRVVTHSFFCGAGLLFDQKSLTCQDADKVNCALSPTLYHLNDRSILPEPEEVDSFQFTRIRSPSA